MPEAVQTPGSIGLDNAAPPKPHESLRDIRREGGWGRGIRTPIDGTKNRCPAIGRYPSVYVRAQTRSLQNASAEPF